MFFGHNKMEQRYWQEKIHQTQDRCMPSYSEMFLSDVSKELPTATVLSLPMLWPFNTVPHVVVTLSREIILLLLHNWNVIAVCKHLVCLISNTPSLWRGCLTLTRGIAPHRLRTERDSAPQVENHWPTESEVFATGSCVEYVVSS